jgi:hypothetical protein
VKNEPGAKLELVNKNWPDKSGILDNRLIITRKGINNIFQSELYYRYLKLIGYRRRRIS